MKITCLQETLNDGLNLVSKSVTMRPAADSSAQDVLIEEDNGQLKLSCVDKESGISIIVWVSATIEEVGAISLPVRVLKDLVGQMPAGDLEIETTTKPLGAKIKRGSIDAQMYGHDADDFTKLEITDNGETVSFAAAGFAKSLKRVLPAVSREQTRPILTGVKMELEGEKFTLAAADGYRLTVEKGILLKNSKEAIDIVLPGKAMQELRNLIENSHSEIKEITFHVTENQNQAIFKMPNVHLVTQLMQGSFPNYAKILPSEHSTKIVISLDELRRAVKISTAFVHDNNGIIRLVGKTGEDSAILSVIAQSEDTGENHIDIVAEIEGEDIKCAFNYRFLNDLLDNWEGDKVIFSTLSASSAGLFRTAALEEYRHVIMPIYVQW